MPAKVTMPATPATPDKIWDQTAMQSLGSSLPEPSPATEGHLVHRVRGAGYAKRDYYYLQTDGQWVELKTQKAIRAAYAALRASLGINDEPQTDAEIFAKAKETGEAQVLRQYNVEPKGRDRDEMTAIRVTVWANPDGSTRRNEDKTAWS